MLKSNVSFGQKTRSMMGSGLSLVMVFAVLVTVFPKLAEARYEPKPAWNMVPLNQEVQIGQQAAADTDRKLPILPASNPISQYVARLGADIAAHTPGTKFPFSYKVVNQKDVNAFALPGGPIYVNLGTIQAADNESELAGVLAHETSHVVMRHATAAASKQMVAQAGLGVLGGLLGRGAGAQLAAMGIQFGAGSYFLKNSRNAESQADMVGAQIMYDSGFNPQGMVDFFRKLQGQGGSRGPQFMSDHPDPGNRAQAVASELQGLPAKNYRTDSAEFQNIKRMASGMSGYTAQQIAAGQWQNSNGSRNNGNGSVNGSSGTISQISRDVYPSGNYRALNHQAFQISYPDNWQVMGDQSSAVTIAPPAGVTDNAVAYGVMINGFQPEQGQNASLDQATHELVASLRQSNPQMRQVGHDEDLSVNGQNAKSVDLIGASPLVQNGRAARERDWMVTMQNGDGNVVYLIFIAPDRDYSVLRPTFENMLRSFQLR